MKQTMLQQFLECMYQSAKLNDALFQREMTKSEFGVLEVTAIKYQEKGCPVSVNELAATMQCSPPAISRTLRSLEGKGLVERSINKEDRRGIHVTMTERGEELRKKEENYLWKMFQKVMDQVGDEKLSMYLEVWSEILSAFLDSAENPPD